MMLLMEKTPAKLRLNSFSAKSTVPNVILRPSPIVGAQDETLSLIWLT
jgi:hypothetical protein